MKTVIVEADSWFNIEGRGQVVTAIQEAHKFDLRGLVAGETILIDGSQYKVRGIEFGNHECFGFETRTSYPIGILVTKIET